MAEGLGEQIVLLDHRDALEEMLLRIAERRNWTVERVCRAMGGLLRVRVKLGEGSVPPGGCKRSRWRLWTSSREISVSLSMRVGLRPFCSMNSATAASCCWL